MQNIIKRPIFHGFDEDPVVYHKLSLDSASKFVYKNSKYSKVRLYGTAEDPLFRFEDFESIIGKNNYNFRLDKYIEHYEIIYADGYHLLTQHGLKKLLSRNISQLAIPCYKFFTHLIHDLKIPKHTPHNQHSHYKKHTPRKHTPKKIKDEYKELAVEKVKNETIYQKLILKYETHIQYYEDQLLDYEAKYQAQDELLNVVKEENEVLKAKTEPTEKHKKSVSWVLCSKGEETSPL